MAINKRLLILFFVIFFFILSVTFSSLQLSKGARFHQLNSLHLKYVIDLQTLLANNPDSLPTEKELQPILQNIKDQPQECLNILNPLDKLIMQFIGTDRAITLCENDVALADEVFQQCANYMQGKISAAQMRSSLETASRQFSLNSIEFEQPINDTVDFTIRTITTLIVVLSAVVLFVIISIIRGIALLVEQMEENNLALTNATPGISKLDTDGHYINVNEAYADLLGYGHDELIGSPWISTIHEESRCVAKAAARKAAKEGKGEFEARGVCKDGSDFYNQVLLVSITGNDGQVIGYHCFMKDITEKRQLTEQLIYQANHDSLTGLVNRSEFERRAERLLSTTKKDMSEHALCFMDLDLFKVVNDTCGHIAGDEMLRQLGSVLQNTIRHRDILARLGGDEFGVLMEYCSLDDAHHVAMKLQKVIQDYQLIWDDHTFKVGVSMGLVPITKNTTHLTELLRDADAACYIAKESGRNRIHVYHPDDTETAQRHGEMQWVTRINKALDEDRFCLYAQTILPLDGSDDKHYELLIRLKDEKGKLIPPNAFLPSAERYDLIEKLDTWVISKAFSLLAENPTFLNQIHFISINLSGQSLTKPGILDFIITQLDKSGIEGKKICFEITETAAIANLSTAIKFISTLKTLGCRFALDDFGSGLSSFAYLKNLPVDYLKIDGMFVKDIVDDPIDHAMVKSINEIGQVMGMQTIAEFVENDVIKGMLKEIGVNYAQGYGIDKPQPFEELLGRENNIINIKNINLDTVNSCPM